VAASQLTVHLDEVERSGAALPKSSSFDAIGRDPLYVDRVATVSLTRSDLFWVVDQVIPAVGRPSTKEA
jgi:hypothetical protein